MTVTDLQKFCTNPIEEGRVICGFYIWGVTEGASLGSGTEPDGTGKLREKHNRLICLPEDTSRQDVQKIVADAISVDLMKYPEDSKMPAVSFVMAVVTRNFPCSGQ